MPRAAISPFLAICSFYHTEYKQWFVWNAFQDACNMHDHFWFGQDLTKVPLRSNIGKGQCIAEQHELCVYMSTRKGLLWWKVGKFTANLSPVAKAATPKQQSTLRCVLLLRPCYYMSMLHDRHRMLRGSSFSHHLQWTSQSNSIAELCPSLYIVNFDAQASARSLLIDCKVWAVTKQGKHNCGSTAKFI